MGCCVFQRIEEKYTLTNNTQVTKRSNADINYNISGSRREDYVKSTLPDSVSYRQKKLEIKQTREVKGPSIEISPEIVKNGKKMTLTVMEANFIKEGTILHFNPGGLESSERLAKDGSVFFGKQSDEFLNDFNFPSEESVGDRQFEIKYDIIKDCYKAKNLFGTGLFYKIDKKLLLKNNCLFSFGTPPTHITVHLPNNVVISESGEPSILKPKLVLKVIFGVNMGKIYTIDGEKTQIVRLGRTASIETDIVFKEESISRVQCTIFLEDSKWYIIDGDYEKKKFSMNSTWYLMDEFMELSNKSIIKSGTTSFEVTI